METSQITASKKNNVMFYVNTQLIIRLDSCIFDLNSNYHEKSDYP